MGEDCGIVCGLWFVVMWTMSFHEVGGGASTSCLSRFHCSAVARTSDNICITLAYLELPLCMYVVFDAEC